MAAVAKGKGNAPEVSFGRVSFSNRLAYLLRRR
jgi:hypothetical protein